MEPRAARPPRAPSNRFVAKYGAKYAKAAACLVKDRAALLAFSNPIGGTFATVRLRTGQTKGRPSRRTALATVHELTKSAERHGRRLDGSGRLARVIEGVRFRDGEPVRAAGDRAAAGPRAPNSRMARGVDTC
jgi:hypothetical protein